jgi:hypothetical protein
MGLFSKKLLFRAALVCTALAVMGYFVLMAAEPLRVISYEVKNSAANEITGLRETSFPNPGEGIAVIARPGNAGFVPLGMGLQRTVFLPEQSGVGSVYSKSAFIQNSKTLYTYLINTIFLKLRI